MRVLVTRPEQSARRTAQAIAALGHEPVLLPLFRPEHAPDLVRQALAERPSGLVFTSAEAVRSLDRSDVDRAALLSLPIYAVGEATADAARELGFTGISTSGGNGEALAEHIADIHPQGLPPLLYLAGEPRSPGLEQGLAKRRIAVRICTAYRMVPVDYGPKDIAAIIGNDRPVAVLLYSREAALRLAALITDKPLPIRQILCLSPTIATALPSPLAPLARAADAPREDCLLALLPPA